jgi:pyruvate dehydrogenase E1 component beta subunit
LFPHLKEPLYVSQPLDKAAVTREGTDVSIITYGAMVREAIKAADSLAKDNISAEIIDLRTVSDD